MKIKAYKRRPEQVSSQDQSKEEEDKEEEVKLEGVFGPGQLEEMVQDVDYLVVAAALTPSTRHMSFDV